MTITNISSECLNFLCKTNKTYTITKLKLVCQQFELRDELQKSCGYAGTTHEEGLPYVRSLRKVSTFNQLNSAKSAGTRNKKSILNDITSIILRKI